MQKIGRVWIGSTCVLLKDLVEVVCTEKVFKALGQGVNRKKEGENSYSKYLQEEKVKN